MKLIHKKDQNYSQIFEIFSEESWEINCKNYNKNVSLFFSGKKYEVFVDAQENSVTYLLGIGNSQAKDFDYQQVALKFSQTHKKDIQPVSTSVIAESITEKQFEEFVKGLYLGTYNYPFDKNHPFWSEKFEIHSENFDQSILNVVAQKTNAICEGQTACQDWLNKPANLKRPEAISNYLKDIAEKYSLQHTVFNREKCEEFGLGAYLSVNQGSAYDAAFTILEYETEEKNAKTIGLVGKCVLFDTGGISIKGGDNMHYMKSDMGGATAVIGALIYAAEMKLPYNITAILPVTDNAVSAKAYLPSDVITAYNGKTIEVLNTDAEGRMTLADGLSYLTKNYQTFL